MLILLLSFTPSLAHPQSTVQTTAKVNHAAKVIEDWTRVEPGKNLGSFQDTLGSKIDFAIEEGPGGSKALKMTSLVAAFGWCGIWGSLQADLSQDKSLRFKVRCNAKGKVQLSLVDAWKVQYVALFDVSPGDWQEVVVPLSTFVKDRNYTPTGAVLGHPMDLSKTSVMNFAALMDGRSVLEIGPVEGSMEVPRIQAPPAAALAANLTYRMEENGELLLFDGPQNQVTIQPELFTEGWQWHSFTPAPGAGGFTAQTGLGSGKTVLAKTEVEAVPGGLRVHYTLVPKETVRVLQIRGCLYLNYFPWQETPYQLGGDKGNIPTVPVGGSGLIAQAEGKSLTLGPSPALGGLAVQMDPGPSPLCLVDNRQWGTNLLAYVTDFSAEGQAPGQPWTWEAGQEKQLDFVLTFNRALAPLPTPTPLPDYGLEGQNSTLVPANDPNLQYSGRFDFSDPLAPRFDWPAVFISAVFQGTAVGILLDDGNNDYDAFIDGKRPQVIQTGNAAQYTIGGLGDGPHTLRLVKRNEASFGIATFKGLLLQKGMSLLKPPPLPSRRIEFVGDSLACGAETEYPHKDCEPTHFRPTENGDEAYGPLAARALDADYRVTSYSGTGILAQFGTDGLSMPGYYPRVLAGQEKPVVDPRQWAPDAVVVELGGNDLFSANAPSRDEYEDAYRKFIAVLRADYPEARIFCFTFRDSPPANVYIQEVADWENKAGDGKVALLEANYPAAHVTGCYKHFDRVGQQLVADELVKGLREAMGWDGAKTR